MAENSNKLSEQFVDYLTKINFAAVKSTVVVLAEIANKCNSWEEFKAGLSITAENLKKGE